MTGILKYFPFAAILLTGVFCSILTSCQQPADNVTDNIISKPSLPSDNISDNVTGNPPEVVTPANTNMPLLQRTAKVDSQLWELILAYESGGDAAAEAYAKIHEIDFKDGKVLVTIDFKSPDVTTTDTIRAVIDTIRAAGATDIKFKDSHSIRAFVPVSQLKSLYNYSVVLQISLPIRGGCC